MRAAAAMLAAVVGCGGGAPAAVAPVAPPPVVERGDEGVFVDYVDGVETSTTEMFQIEPRDGGWSFLITNLSDNGSGKIAVITDAAFAPISGEIVVSMASGQVFPTTISRDASGTVSVTANFGGNSTPITAPGKFDIFRPGAATALLFPICRRDPTLSEHLVSFPDIPVDLMAAVSLTVDGGRSVTTRELRYPSYTVVVACEDRRVVGGVRKGTISVRRGDEALAKALAAAK